MLIAGRYRLSESIGRGGMGEVWRAYDDMLARHVAVKLLLPQDTDPTATSRFRLEAQTAARIDHPNVVGVRDFGEHDNRLYLVMELIGGDSLAHVLTHSGAQPAERVARIAAEAAAGLEAAHRQGIVHRDIKPGNLLLDSDGTLKIADFGIARFMDDPGAALTATGQIVGTSLYLAPERALGQQAGPASDVYALGCVLYQLLTGRPPFQADSAVAILHQHLDAAPVPPRELGVTGLPPAFENYLLGLLAKDPEQRPAAQRVADWFAGGAWRGRPEPLPEVTAAPRRGGAAPPAAGPRQVGGTSAPTTYMLPSKRGHAAEGRARSRPARSAGPDRQARSRSAAPDRPTRSRSAGPDRQARSRSAGPDRPTRSRARARPRPSRPGTGRIAVMAAGAALFVAAMLLGMTWFSPDSTGGEGTRSDASPSPGTSASTDSTDSTGPRTAAPTRTRKQPPAPTPAQTPTPTPSTSGARDGQGADDRRRDGRQPRRGRDGGEQDGASQPQNDGDGDGGDDGDD